MKKIFIVLSMASFIVACGNNQETKTSTPTTSTTDLSSNPDYQKGLELIAKNDCLTCHKIDSKLIGPPYRDVAAKYSSSDVQSLATKIIKGGQGVWGNTLMTPHASLSQADAEQMVKYILLLKK